MGIKTDTHTRTHTVSPLSEEHPQKDVQMHAYTVYAHYKEPCVTNTNSGMQTHTHTPCLNEIRKYTQYLSVQKRSVVFQVSIGIFYM